jgi:aromatic-amino-acid transaminase
MAISCVAPHAQGKINRDRIFGASDAAQKRIKQIGAEKVTNATIGSILDNDEKFAVLPTVSKIYRSLKDTDYFKYAPIVGLGDYQELVQKACFGESRPEGVYTAAVATAGGTGAVHHSIWNYTMPGDTVITSDWYWGPYKVLCRDMNRELDTYPLVTADRKFNLKGLTDKVHEVVARQDRVEVIINTPAHNPTGFSLTPEEITDVLHMLEDSISGTKKTAVLVLDVAYLDYAGEREEVRKIFRSLGHLPENIFVLICYSMSKSFTMYGMRCGALIGVSSSKEQIEEFVNVNKVSCRSTWSNCSRGAMTTLNTIYQSEELLNKIQEERNYYYKMVQERGDVFTKEAEACGLNMVPYISGFFLSIPAKDSQKVCDKLHDDDIFCVPLAAGVRVAVCAVPLKKIYGMAAKIKKAMDACGE